MQVVVKGLALDQAHDEIPVMRIAEAVEDARQHGMAQGGEDVGLAVEGIGGLDNFLGGESLQVDLLEGDQASVFLGVACFVDRAKAAGADLGEQLVVFMQQRTTLLEAGC